MSATQVVLSVLQGAGFRRTDDPESANVVLLNTCAIREGAEQRIWGRLGRFKALKAERRSAARREKGCVSSMARQTCGRHLFLNDVSTAEPRRARRGSDNCWQHSVWSRCISYYYGCFTYLTARPPVKLPCTAALERTGLAWGSACAVMGRFSGGRQMQ